MTMFLKQSTSVVLSLGPFVSPTDGVTLVTSLVSAIDHATTGIFLSKNGGTLTIRSQAVTASTYDSYGNYKVTLSTTDTNTLGGLRVQWAAAASCLPVWKDCMVVPANVWDSLFGATFLKVDAAQWLTQTIAAVDTNGYPKVTIKDGTGTGEIDTNAGAIAHVILSDTLTTYTGNTVQTGDSFARIGATGSGLSSLATPASILTTALTESYNADGAAPTLAQALFLLISCLTEFSISGTTITAKKLDGSTTAATFTLDSATTPTSRTRAT